MKAVISVTNVAARSGKTTTAVNLAVELATRGIRTLLVDADPQARATAFFMKPGEVVRTLSDVLLPQMRRATERPAAVWDVFSPADFPHLGVVASGIGLATFGSLESTHATDLRARLGPISGFHDVAILDTPSSLALLTRACLRASTHVIAPVSPGGQGEEGLNLVAECLSNMPCEPIPAGVWVVCNRFDCRDRTSGRLYERLKARWGGRVFDTIVHRDDLIEGSAERRRPAQGFAPASKAADLYARLADEVLTRAAVAPPTTVTAAAAVRHTADT